MNKYTLYEGCKKMYECFIQDGVVIFDKKEYTTITDVLQLFKSCKLTDNEIETIIKGGK